MTDVRDTGGRKGAAMMHNMADDHMYPEHRMLWSAQTKFHDTNRTPSFLRSV